MYLFPFEKIQQGSKIVIYGFGRAGRSYLAQLQRSQYAEVICFIDKATQNYKKISVPVVSIDSFCEETPLYDYILVAVMDKCLGENIRYELMNRGIPHDKVITAYQRNITVPQCDKNLCMACIENPNRLHDVFQEFFLMGEGKREYFIPFGEVLIRFLNPSGRKEWIQQALNVDLSNKERIILVCALYDAGIVSGELTKTLISCLNQIHDDIDSKYMLTMDLGWWFTGLPDGLYDDFYLDRRELLKSLAKDFELKVHPSSIPTMPAALKKIAICALSYQVPIHLGCIDGMVLRYANELCNLGYEIGIIVLGTFENMDTHCFIDPLYPYDDSHKHTEQAAKYMNPRVKVFYRYEKTIKKRLQGVIDDIETFHPDVILDMSDEQFVQSYILKESFPIAYFPWRGYASSVFFHTFITSNMQYCIENNKKYRSVAQSQMVEVVAGCLPYLVNAKKPYRRKDFGFKEDDFIIVTVGSRLEVELDSVLIHHMQALLERYGRLRWVLVGSMPNLSIKFDKNLLAQQRIIFWGYETYLSSLYEICDLYLNPKRMGGNISISTAMLSGLPIAMLYAYADCLTLVGEENTVHGDYYDLIEYVRELYLDVDLYRRTSDAMKKRIQNHLPESNAKKVAEALLLCCERTCGFNHIS